MPVVLRRETLKKQYLKEIKGSTKDVHLTFYRQDVQCFEVSSHKTDGTLLIIIPCSFVKYNFIQTYHCLLIPFNSDSLIVYLGLIFHSQMFYNYLPLLYLNMKK